MPLPKLLAVPAGAAVAAVVAVGAPAMAGGGATQFASCPGEVWAGVVGTYEFEFCFTSVTRSGGDAQARFHGQLVPGVPAPAQAQSLRGFPCQAGFPSRDVSTNSRLVVMPDGRVNGTCKS